MIQPKPVAWVVGDAYGVRQELMHELGWNVVHISADLYSVTHPWARREFPPSCWWLVGTPGAALRMVRFSFAFSAYECFFFFFPSDEHPF